MRLATPERPYPLHRSDLSIGSLAIELSERADRKGCRRHLREGFLRRQLMIRDAVIRIEKACPRESRPPLFEFEANQATLDLNSIYLHLRGCLDNLAWAMQVSFELLPGVRENQPRGRSGVYLFGDDFLRALDRRERESAAKLREVKTWAEELKGLRDPAAHRIPLYVPPGIIFEDSGSFEELKHATVAFDPADSGADLSLTEWAAKARSSSHYFPVFIASLPDDLRIYRLHAQLDWDLAHFFSCAESALNSLRVSGSS